VVKQFYSLLGQRIKTDRYYRHDNHQDATLSLCCNANFVGHILLRVPFEKKNCKRHSLPRSVTDDTKVILMLILFVGDRTTQT
jgi:hypothetical protein